MSRMQIIHRDDLEAITSVVVDESVHDIGLLKDFHRHPALKEFIPDLARVSMSWVRLLPDQAQAVHRHPVKSMVVAAVGSGRTLGEVRQEIGPGDIVLLPPGDDHGFVGTGPAGFWALSIQFEGAGLYENTESPRVSYLADRHEVAAVRAANERHMAGYRDSALIRLVAHPDATTGESRQRALDHLQQWSDGFQRVIAARVAGEIDTPSRRLAEEHLAEELGHNTLLGGMRAGRVARRDPVVAAASSWFVDRMTSSSTVDRIVLAHLVLEGSGLVFHNAGLTSFAGSRYFELHDGADVEHLEAGYAALADRDDWSVERVEETLREGWEMITLFSDRVAERAHNG
ncbi:hypothetical protein OG948_41745 (plasmid) [Embleya sp. NBC_00888]|uniref:hypothetical protein n=1 Tax=Embleya sp. NBC_00888 TaxID=2975960 RepID=UPI002F90CE8A|nr:hypothetical protein OG948_41745 [Embleya sp. NBC_00888]